MSAKWLGVRCWASRIALAVAEDSPDGPVAVFVRRQPCPTGLNPGERAAWFAKVVTEAIDESGATGVAVRIADSGPDQERAEADGAVLASAALRGLTGVTLRRQSLLKPLGVPRGAGGWAAFQKSDPFIGALVGDLKDAAMASLGAARR